LGTWVRTMKLFCSAERIATIGVTALLTSTVSIAAATDERGGLFSRSQADRGAKIYAEHCALCHGLNLEGKGAPALSGAVFQAKWADGKHTLDDLYYIIRTSMPSSAPGKLSQQQYVDLVAYILRSNGYREGEQELVANTATLRAVTIQPQ